MTETRVLNLEFLPLDFVLETYDFHPKAGNFIEKNNSETYNSR